MSGIRFDGVYLGYPSNSKAGNWETLRFLNESEVIFSNNAINLSFDSYDYNNSSLEFGKYSLRDDESIIIETTRKNKQNRTIMEGRVDGNTLILSTECENLGSIGDLKYKFQPMDQYKTEQSANMKFTIGCLGVLILVGIISYFVFF